MLESILTQAVPLKSHVDLPDPNGWGFLLRIYRKKSTEYAAAERKLPVYSEFVSSLKDQTQDDALKGMRRGKGGKVMIPKRGGKKEKGAYSLPVLGLGDRLPAIARHLALPVAWPDDVAWPSKPAAGGRSPT